MADLSYNELVRMQNDAVRRVEEMQKKAREVSGEKGPPLKETPPKETPPKDPFIPADRSQRVQEAHHIPMPDDYLRELKRFAATSSHASDKGGSVSESQKPLPPQPSELLKTLMTELNMDSDKALILSLVMLLSDDHADEMLILALLYILT